MNREAGSEETRAVETRAVEPVAFKRSGALGPGSTRSIRRGMLALAGFVLLAIVKPWGAAEEPVRLPPRAFAVASAVPIRPDDPIEDICHASPSWRVASVGQFVGIGLREWVFVNPVAAAGPGDPSIPFVLFGFSRVSALGYCAPMQAIPQAGMEVRVFRVDGDGAGTLIDVLREDRTPATSVAGLFSVGAADGEPASGTLGPTASWPPGRYVFALGGQGYRDVWFGAELRPTLGRPVTEP